MAIPQASQTPPPDTLVSVDPALPELARFLRRAEGGFALMLAACNDAAHRDACLRALSGSVSQPQVIVPATAETEDAVTLAQQVIGAGKPAALHLIRLELAVPADESRLTSIRQLNLRRSEWRQFNCPVVLWVPEYLLGILLRQAPDFADWRSGSLVFVPAARLSSQRGLVLDSAQDMSPLDDRALDWQLAHPEDRKARITELRVRLGLDERGTQAPVIRSDIEAGWVAELIYLLTLSLDEEAATRLLPVLNTHWQDQLHERVWVHLNLTDIWRRIGKTSQAWASAQQALKLSQIRNDKEPENPEAHRNLSVSYERLGDVAVAQGNLELAARLYGDALKLTENRGQSDPGDTQWQRDLSISYEKLGDVAVAQGNLDKAARLYGDALKLTEKLAPSDPGNTLWQRDLSISYEKLGDVAVAQGNLEQAARLYGNYNKLAEKLALSDPGNTEWQRDLSISCNKLGEVAVAQGNLEQAARLYGDYNKLAEKLARSDPSNTQWQRDLSVSYEKLGNVAVAQGNLEQAARLYGDALKLREKLALSDPVNTQWQRDLSVSYYKLGDLQQHQEQWDLALPNFERCLFISERLSSSDPTNVTLKNDVQASREALQQVREKLGR